LALTIIIQYKIYTRNSFGAKGNMGKVTIEGISKIPDMEIVFEADKDDNIENAIYESNAMVVVDFTTPDSVFENTMKIIHAGACPVVGTTGLNKKQMLKIATELENKSLGGIVAPNFSLGALLMIKLSKVANRFMHNCEIIELHNDKKLDSPSGTALKTREFLSHSEKNKRELPSDYSDSRGLNLDGVHIHSIRLPGLLAHQKVIFGNEGETLTISHNAISRDCFVPGIVLAVREVTRIKGLQEGLNI